MELLNGLRKSPVGSQEWKGYMDKLVNVSERGSEKLKFELVRWNGGAFVHVS